MLPVIADFFGISTDALLGRVKEKRRINDEIEYYEGAIYREDFCGGDDFFDTLEIEKAAFDKCGPVEGPLMYLTTIFYKSYDPDYITNLQSVMSFKLKPYVDNIERHTDGTVYHV